MHFLEKFNQTFFLLTFLRCCSGEKNAISISNYPYKFFFHRVKIEEIMKENVLGFV